jgi:pteridine reductase
VKLEGRVALVTGAGQRLGRALAIALGRAQMDVAVHYHASAEGAADTVRMIEDAGGRSQSFQSDLSSREGPARLVNDVVDAFGPLDVLVNSAAGMERLPFADVTMDQWDATMNLNLRGPFFLAQAAAAAMREGGAIVNISDLAAFETWPAYIPHSISKAAIVKMTEGLARVLAPSIRVNAIAPGAVLLPAGWDATAAEHLSKTTPLGKLGDPQDVVGAMLYLLGADYVTGETIIVDGGRHIRK